MPARPKNPRNMWFEYHYSKIVSSFSVLWFSRFTAFCVLYKRKLFLIILINLFSGYFCPGGNHRPNQTEYACPAGTYTDYTNLTAIEQCDVCPETVACLLGMYKPGLQVQI